MNLTECKRFILGITNDTDIVEHFFQTLEQNPVDFMIYNWKVFDHLLDGECKHNHTIQEAGKAGLALGMALAFASSRPAFKEQLDAMEKDEQKANKALDDIIKKGAHDKSS